MSADPTNIHATALILGDRGILIRGAAGSGKTTLALTLIGKAHRIGRFAALIADDQSLVAARGGRLIASAPRAIAGLAEVYGLGPQPIDFRRAGPVDLVVNLLDTRTLPRFQEPSADSIAGVALPLISLAARESQRSMLAIIAQLGWPPFGS